ncbi:MAG: sulfotransferase [Thermoanaerobaculia bacterium]
MRVVYIAGLGRSGSTLLARLLGQLPGWVSVGELHNLWRTGAPGGSAEELCGCGRSFAECTFWPPVLATALAGTTAEEAADLAAATSRIRHVPLLAGPWRPKRWSRRLERYADVVGSLYGAAARNGEARVVVDSSKDAGPLWLLTRVPGVDVSVLHLVRDPRGVAHSWGKRLRRSEFVDREVWMPSWGPAETAWRWTYTNLLAEAAGRRLGACRRVRYEDLVADPRGTLAALVRWVDPQAGEGTLPVTGSRARFDRTTHTLAGNPMRFESGPVEIRADDAWRRDLPRTSRGIVTALTWPLLRRYGYPLRVAR